MSKSETDVVTIKTLAFCQVKHFTYAKIIFSYSKSQVERCWCLEYSMRSKAPAILLGNEFPLASGDIDFILVFGALSRSICGLAQQANCGTKGTKWANGKMDSKNPRGLLTEVQI